MSGKRIVVVGGGSGFACVLAEGIVDQRFNGLDGSTVVLLDIQEENLDEPYEYACRLARAVGADIRFERTLDRRRAFEGADFIVNTFRPGSYDQQEQDESVPPKYGLQGNETVGIGGIFMACRTIAILRDIVADAQALCPDAWFLNYTNPTQHVADAVRRLSNLKAISMCDGWGEIANDLAPFLGVEPKDITLYPAGTNHAIWLMRFTVKGQDGYPLLRERLSRMTQEEIDAICTPPPDYPYSRDEQYKQFIPREGFPFDLRLLGIYGLLPAPRYYWRYHMDQDAVIAEERSGRYVSMATAYKTLRKRDRPERMEQRLARAVADLKVGPNVINHGHTDLAVRIMTAICGNLGRCEAINVPNNGAISNLPYGSIVEVPAIVDAQGYHPLAMGPLPKELLGYQYALILSQELTVDAALRGSRNDLLKAILAHPLIHSVDAAERCMDELLALQAEWLPQFHQKRA
ncbi:MAG: hypothetical protein QME94_03495 [Anaerolineae bacterium]|nr:hypothetical protein [Anaerolineae bacterium]